jgi:hypothetical protein
MTGWLPTVLLALPFAAAAQTWSIEAYVGDAYNFRTRLEVSQDGGFSRTLRADYETRGFETPLYYMLRAGRWNGERAWEAALIHHKVYLRNPPTGVADLSISHGFNILAVSLAARRGDWTYRFGAGPVITHAEATITGVRYDGPYRLSGAALVAGGGRRFNLGKSAFLSAELMASAAYARPKLEGTPSARIETGNVALHAVFGLGVDVR